MALNLGELLVRLGIDISGFEKNLSKATKDIQQQGERMQRVGDTLTKSLTLPILAIGTVSAKAAVDFESAFAGVRKTVNATEAEFAQLEKGIRDMAMQLPASTTEIAAVAEAAGQLGIKTEGLLQFTETMLKLGTTTNMSSTEAATALARLANITQMPQTEFDKLGSTIVDLGNNLATTEAEIVEMGLRIAGAGKTIGLTEAQILGFAGALSSVGIEAQAGGSAISRVMIQIASEVASGGENLGMFAAVAGQSVEGFRQAFQQDAAGAIIEFIEGLGRMQTAGQNVFGVLDELGLSEIRVRDALLRASGAGDLFRQSLELGTKAWTENNALNKEAEQRYKTLASRFQMLRNQLSDIAISIGEGLVPALEVALAKIKPLLDAAQKGAQGFADLDKETQGNIIQLALFAAAVGPLLKIITKIATGILGLIAVGKTLSFAFAAWMGGAATFGEALAFVAGGPVGVIIAVILALIAAGVLLWKNWDKIMNVGLNVWASLKVGFLEFSAALVRGYGRIVEIFNKAEGEKARALERSLLDQAEKERQIYASRKTNLERMAQDKMEQEAEASYYATEVAEKEAARQKQLAEEKAAAAKKAAEERAQSEQDIQASMGATTAAEEKAAKAQRLALQKIDYELSRLDSQWAVYSSQVGNATDTTEYQTKQTEFLDARLQLLGRQLEEASRQYEASKTKTGEFSEETMELGTQLDATSREIAATTAAMSEMDAKLQRLSLQKITHELSNLDSQWTIYTSRVGKATDTVQHQAKQVEYLGGRLQILYRQLEEVSGQYEASKTKTGEFSEETMKLGSQLNTINQEISSTRAEFDEMSGPIAIAKENLSKATVAVSDMQKWLETLGDRLKTAKERFDNTSKSIKELQDSTKDAQQGIANLLGVMANRIKDVESEMKDLTSSSKDAQQGVSDALATMKARADEVTDSISTLRNKMQDVAGIRLAGEGALGQELKDLQRREALVKLAVNQLKQSGAKADDSRIVALEKQLNALQLQKEGVQLRIETEIEPLRDQLKAMTEDVKEMTFGEARQSILDYQRQIVELTAKHTNMTTQIDAFSAEFQGLVPSLGKGKDSFDDAARSLGAYKVKLLENEQALGVLTTKHSEMTSEYETLRQSVANLVPKIGDADMSFAEAKVGIDAFKSLIEANNAKLDGPGGLIALQAQQQGTLDILNDVLKTFQAELETLTGKEREAASALDTLRQAAASAAGAFFAATFTKPDTTGADATKVLQDTQAAPGGGGRMFEMAEGGITKRPLIARIGERAREVVAPLNELPHLLSGYVGKVANRMGGSFGTMSGDGQMALSAMGDLALQVYVQIGDQPFEDAVVRVQEKSRRRGRS